MSAANRAPRLPVDWRTRDPLPCQPPEQAEPRLNLLQRLRRWMRAHLQSWLPANREDRDAAYFLAGEVWMGFLLGGVWLAVHFL